VRRKAAKRTEEWYQNGAGPLLIPARKKRSIEKPPLPLPASTDEASGNTAFSEISEGLPPPVAAPPSTDTVNASTRCRSPRQTQTQLPPIETSEAQLDGDHDKLAFVPYALRSPDTSYKEREDVLKDIISSGKKVPRGQVRIYTKKKKAQTLYSKDQLDTRGDDQKKLGKVYLASGMSVHGYV
jgi:hypothetical protein